MVFEILAFYEMWLFFSGMGIFLCRVTVNRQKTRKGFCPALHGGRRNHAFFVCLQILKFERIILPHWFEEFEDTSRPFHGTRRSLEFWHSITRRDAQRSSEKVTRRRSRNAEFTEDSNTVNATPEVTGPTPI
jgi:hypothetical protein